MGGLADGTRKRAEHKDEWVDETDGWVNNSLALPEWEAFAGFVTLVAEGVGTVVDGIVEALRQQHNSDVQAYKARIDHLESMLTSLGIHEPLQLLPTTGGASTA